MPSASGAGGIVRWAHLGGWNAIPDAEIVAIADVDEARAQDVARENQITHAFKDYRDLVKLDLDRRSARVENAVESTPAQMESIKGALAQKYGPGMNVTFWVNPALLGGVKITATTRDHAREMLGR